MKSINRVVPLASIILIGLLPLQAMSAAEEKKTAQVEITKGVVSIDAQHNGKTIKLTRNQDKKNEIDDFYRNTSRGTIQSMHPFKPHQVETIAEREMIDYIKKASAGDKSILIVDSRTPSWVEMSGLIPGAINIPYTKFEDTDDAVEIMEEKFGVLVGDTLSFSHSKTLVMYCNGAWCGQSPMAIKKLLSIGYPAANIKYYRGGMQSWASLGLTVVKEDE